MNQKTKAQHADKYSIWPNYKNKVIKIKKNVVIDICPSSLSKTSKYH